MYIEHGEIFGQSQKWTVSPPLIISTCKLSEDRKKFYALAKKNIVFRDYSEELEHERQIFGPNHQTPHNLKYTVGFDMNKERTISSVFYLQISVLVESIFPKYKEIYPFLLEHEIYEAWTTIKPGSKNKNPHLAARKREITLARKHGKLNLLIEHLLEWGGEKAKNEIEPLI